MTISSNLFKEILVSGASEAAIFERFFNRHGPSLIYEDEKLPYYLGVAGLPEDEQYHRDSLGLLPKWYISRNPRNLAESAQNRACMELSFIDRFDQRVIIQFYWMGADRSPEVALFVDHLIARIRQVAQVTDLSMSTTEETHQEEDILRIIQDVARMKQHPKRSGYSLRTALVIYQAIIPAYKRYKHQGWQWGVSCFDGLLDEMSTATISRYFKDWYEEGIILFPSEELGDIPNPYHPRKASR